MTTSPRSRRLLVAALAPAALALAAASVSAESPDAGIATSESAAPSSSAAQSPALGPVGSEIPKEESAAPTSAEWSKAKPVKPRGQPRDCTFLLLREWLKVHCPTYSAVGLVAGDPKGVSVKATNPDTEREQREFTTSVVLPLRRGEAKVVSFLVEGSQGYAMGILEHAALLSVVWRAGRPDPIVLMR